jgi:hypothetical protein
MPLPAPAGAPPLTPALQLALTAPRRLPAHAVPVRREFNGAAPRSVWFQETGPAQRAAHERDGKAA